MKLENVDNVLRAIAHHYQGDGVVILVDRIGPRLPGGVVRLKVHGGDDSLPECIGVGETLEKAVLAAVQIIRNEQLGRLECMRQDATKAKERADELDALLRELVEGRAS